MPIRAKEEDNFSLLNWNNPNIRSRISASDSFGAMIFVFPSSVLRVKDVMSRALARFVLLNFCKNGISVCRMLLDIHTE